MLVMNDIYFLEGGWRGRLVTSHISLMGHSVRLLTFALGGSSRSTKVNFTDNSFDSCLAHTSNVVQASLAVPLLKILHLRWSQTTAARSLVGPYCGSCARDEGWGRRTFSSWDRHSSVVVFRGGSWTRLR